MLNPDDELRPPGQREKDCYYEKLMNSISQSKEILDKFVHNLENPEKKLNFNTGDCLAIYQKMHHTQSVNEQKLNRIEYVVNNKPEILQSYFGEAANKGFFLIKKFQSIIEIYYGRTQTNTHTYIQKYIHVHFFYKIIIVLHKFQF